MKISTTRWLKPLFPTTVEIVGERVIIIYHEFLASQRTEIDIRDIYNVEVDSNLWFAEVVVYSRMFVDNVIKVSKLWKKDAEAFQAKINELRKQYHIEDIKVIS